MIWINQHIDAILFQDQGKKHVSIMPDTFRLKAVNHPPMLDSHLQERPVLPSERDTTLGRNGIEVLTTQDSCDFSLADTHYTQDPQLIKAYCVKLLVAGSHLIKGVNVLPVIH